MRAVVSLVALLAAAGACAAKPPEPPPSPGWRDAAVETRPKSYGGLKAPGLRFAGGLVLRSADTAFGGWSGLELLPDGRLVAISDAGSWLEARPVLDAGGRLVGLEGARLAPLAGLDGRPFPSKRAGDAEGLAVLPDGRLAVSFEQDHRVWIYDLAAGPMAAPVAGPAIPQAERLRVNEGLEALAELDGALIAGAERSPEGGEAWWWRLGPDPNATTGPHPAPISPAFSLVALDRLPPAFGGDLVALERLYAPLVGARLRIRRISGEALAAGRFEGPVVAELNGGGGQVDNFEAVAAVETPDGARLYLLSDDNFRSSQRTLLYAFDWAP